MKHLGKALVVAKEQKDGDALIALKQTHENTLHALVMYQKKLALYESNKALDGLHQSRKAPEYRMKHNLDTLSKDLGAIPIGDDDESEFKEIADKIEARIVDGGMKLISS